MSAVSSQNSEYASIYTLVTTIFVHSMNLDEAVEEALATYDMSRSDEAEETGRTVATLQD